MTIRLLLAALHLLALAIGFGAIVARASALRDILDVRGVRRVLRADNWWGVAALLWLATGLARLLLGTEKPTAYYIASRLFWLKMGLFFVVLALEIAPMAALIGWRLALRRGVHPETKNAGRYALLSTLEALLVVVIVSMAVALARGYDIVLPF
jgi:putative membrane protein